MTFVIKRKIDELGRFVLPADHRRHYGISDGDGVSITLTEKGILVQKEDGYSAESKIVDALGRILIPKPIRKKLNLVAKSVLEVHIHEDGILLVPSTAAEDKPTLPRIDTLLTMLPEENNTYEQDYREKRKQYNEMMSATGHDEAFDLIKQIGIMADIDKRFMELPHIINPTAKVAYEKCLLMLDSWAMLKGGRIKGEVSYEQFDAVISVIFPFFEFLDYSSIEYLRYLSMNARTITFTTTEDANIEMRVRFDYFEDIGDKDAIIEEEIQKHPELVDALNASADRERELLLEDPIMSAFLSQAAEQIGVTPEEYLARFEEVWEDDPMTIMELLHNEFRKKAKRTEDDSDSSDT